VRARDYASENKKLVIVPDEAETVRGIFQRYLELDSIQALATDLDESAVRTKERAWSNGRTVGGERFGNRQNRLDIFASRNGQRWQKLVTDFDVSGFNHNDQHGGFQAARPALAASGRGTVRFSDFRYRGL
jgi:hypothetical protein